MQSRIKTILLLAIFAASALASAWLPGVGAQGFVDRITRPCSNGIGSSLVQTTATNILINPCTNGSITVNGVPLVITPGGGLPDPGSNGIVVRTALLTTAARTITTSGPITISNGSGVAGNPVVGCSICGLTTGALSQFASTTSAQLAGVISDETGSGPLVFATGPVFTNAVRFGTVSSATGQLNLANSASAFLTTIQAGNAAAARTYTWPVNFGSAGAVLTDAGGNGTLSWAVPSPGITPNATVGTVPYLSAATVFSDSPITRLSATHLQIFTGGVGGADFDSSGPNVSLNNGRYSDNGTDIIALSTAGSVKLGDPSSATTGTYAIVFNSGNGVSGGFVNMLAANALGAFEYAQLQMQADPTQLGHIRFFNGNGVGDWIPLDALAGVLKIGDSDASNNGTRAIFDDPAQTIGMTAGNGITLTASVVLTGELTTPKTIRTGTASNTDLAGQLTVGGGGTITYTFTQTYASAPICTSSDTDAAPMITGSSASTTVLTVTGTVGHVVNYICIGRN